MKITRILIGIILGASLLVSVIDSQAQNKNRKRYYSGNELRMGRKKSSSFLSQQWYLGLIMGINLTEGFPGARFSTFSPIDKNEESLYKEYENYHDLSLQAGLDFSFIYKMLIINLQPNFRRQAFSYTNLYEWVDDSSPENTLVLNYDQKQQMDYLEIPLLVKVTFLNGKFKPFIGVGGYYGWLINANKAIVVNGVDRASGSSNPFNRETLSVGATNLFVNYNTGVMASLGMYYDPGNVRITLDVQYRYGFTNIASTSNRFKDNRLAGIGDALDDLSLNNIAINIGVLFPLRFLSNEFSSTE